MPMMKPLKNIVKELREIGEGISNMYRNNNNKNNVHHHHHNHHHRHGKSHIAPECSSPTSSSLSSSPSQSSMLSASATACSSSAMAARRVDQSRWANLPPELLIDIIKRVEVTETSWPSRRAVVACASVCRTWRHITKGLVKTPELCGWITFPISLRQPGPRDNPIQCFIKRERVSSTYRLYLGLSPALSGDMSKLLLAAKKIRKATCTEFLISLVADDFSRSSTTYIGKLRSNFLGTKFMILDGQPSFDPSSLRSSCKSKQILPRVASSSSSSSSSANYNVATVSYELNVLRTRGPRRMRCSMHLIPLSAIQEGGTAPTPMNFTNFFNDLECTTTTPDSSLCSRESLVLRNKAPRWHEQLQCWCLNFKGRVTVASVKNFQLVAAIEPTQNVSAADQEKVILQFGKIGKDIFTMDYRYPLSAFQAFAICLSSFDTKPACE